MGELARSIIGGGGEEEFCDRAPFEKGWPRGPASVENRTRLRKINNAASACRESRVFPWKNSPLASLPPSRGVIAIGFNRARHRKKERKSVEDDSVLVVWEREFERKVFANLLFSNRYRSRICIEFAMQIFRVELNTDFPRSILFSTKEFTTLCERICYGFHSQSISNLLCKF